MKYLDVFFEDFGRLERKKRGFLSMSVIERLYEGDEMKGS